MSENKHLHKSGKILTILFIGLLQLYLYYHFVEGVWLFRFYNSLDSVLILAPSAFVSTFVLSAAFRLREHGRIG